MPMFFRNRAGALESFEPATDATHRFDFSCCLAIVDPADEPRLIAQPPSLYRLLAGRWVFHKQGDTPQEWTLDGAIEWFTQHGHSYCVLPPAGDVRDFQRSSGLPEVVTADRKAEIEALKSDGYDPAIVEAFREARIDGGPRTRADTEERRRAIDELRRRSLVEPDRGRYRQILELIHEHERQIDCNDLTLRQKGLSVEMPTSTAPLVEASGRVASGKPKQPATTPALASLAARDYSEDFRNAAARWRTDPGPIEQHQLGEECGRLIIEADELGYLPPIPELRDRIAWHTAPGDGDRKPGMQAVYVRCPSNLFTELVGGQLIHVRNEGGRCVIVNNPRRGTARHGGILPAARPSALRMPDHERAAVACEWMAQLIEERAATAFGNAPVAASADPKPLADRRAAGNQSAVLANLGDDPPPCPDKDAAAAVILPIVLNGDQENPTVWGVEKPRLTPGQYALVKALIEAYPGRLSKDQLTTRSGVDDPISMIDRLRKDEDWHDALDKPGVPHGGYGIRSRRPRKKSGRPPKRTPRNT